MRHFVLVVLSSFLIVGFVGDKRKTHKPHYNPIKLCVNSVTNNIKIGPLTGNQNLSFGVKNILEEVAQDRGWELVDRFEADQVLDVEIIYFDYEQTKSNMSVFHKDENKVIITMRGTVTENGKVVKSTQVTDRSGEVVLSTGIVAEGGTFSSVMVRNAIKKTCVVMAYRIL
jgi:hypothetical protein